MVTAIFIYIILIVSFFFSLDANFKEPIKVYSYISLFVLACCLGIYYDIIAGLGFNKTIEKLYFGSVVFSFILIFIGKRLYNKRKQT